MGDHDDGHAETGLNFAKEREDLLAVDAVEIAGRFVGEKNCGAIDESASDGAALLFAAGQFRGAMAAACREANVFEGGLDASGAVIAINFGETERELDVFREGHAGEKVEGLEDHTDGVAPVASEFDGVDCSEIAAANVDGAGCGTIESGQEIEKGGLAGAGAAEEGDEFAGADFEGDVVDCGDGGVAELIVAGDVLSLDEWLVGCSHGCGWAEIGAPMVIRVVGWRNFPIWERGFRLGFAFWGTPPGVFVKSGKVVLSE